MRPARVPAALPEAQRLVRLPALEDVQKELATRRLRHYMRFMWPVVEPTTPLVGGWHLDAICDHLEAVKLGIKNANAVGAIRRLIINVPPRMTKSLTVSVGFPTWLWIDAPSFRSIHTSYSQDLSTRDSVKSRAVILSPWYQRNWGDRFALSGDVNLKCLAKGSQVLMANGEPRAIESLKPGDKILSVLQLNENAVIDTIKHVWSNGVKPVRKITLSDGTIVRATHNHRFYGWDAWQYVDDLKVGDALAVLRRIPEHRPTSKMTKDDAFLLALWLSEGSKHDCSYTITTVDTQILRRLYRISERNKWDIRKMGDCTYAMSCARSQTGNTPMSVLKRYIGAIESKKKTGRSRLVKQTVDGIRIPAEVFAASTEVQREFIGTYIACDGSVINGKNYGLTIGSASSDLIYDFALLLKRFGVRSNIDWTTDNYYTYRGERRRCRDAWLLSVKDRAEVLKLADLHMYAKTEKFKSLLVRCSVDKKRHGGLAASIPPNWDRGLPKGRKQGDRHRWSSRAFVERFARDNNFTKLSDKLAGDLDWRRIISIEEDASVETWHLETEKTGTFVVEGIFSHNTRYENDKTGFRLATSVGGMATGEGGDGIFIDDPHNVKDTLATSEKSLQEVMDWFDFVLPSRFNNQKTGFLVLIMQRVHHKDLTGHIIAKELGYHHLCLPMEYEANHPHLWAADPRSIEGELLCPERVGAAELVPYKKSLGQYGSAGQLQQRPAPREGGIIKRAWFTVVDNTPAAPERVVRWWDMAATEKKAGNDPDFTAGAKVGMDADGNAYVMHVVAEQVSSFEVEKIIKETAKADGLDVDIWMEQEPGSAGKALINVYSRKLSGQMGHKFRGEPSTGSKDTFVDVLAAAMESGTVFFVRGPWLEGLMDNACSFPNADHDDDIEAVAKAYCKLATRVRARARNPEADAQARPQAAINEGHLRALEYVRNTGGGATLAVFTDDHEPIGGRLWTDLVNAGLVALNANDCIALTPAGVDALAYAEVQANVGQRQAGIAGAVMDEDMDFEAVAEANARRIYGDAVVDNWAEHAAREVD